MAKYAPYVLTPAYGRDYKSKKALEADLLAGKDFVANNPQGQAYIGIAEIQREGHQNVQVRYDRNLKTAIIKIPAAAPAMP